MTDKVEYRSTGAFRLTNEEGYCSLPIGGDTYHGTCDNACVYCYERQTTNQHLRDARLMANDFRALFQTIYDVPEVREFIVRKKVAIRLGVCADPFPLQEATQRFTLRLLKLLQKAGIQVMLSTKRPGVVDAEHLAVLRDCDKAMIRVSFSTTDDDLGKKLEPGAQTPSERLREMERIARAGVEVGGRFAPLIPAIPHDYMAFANAGCSNVTLELFRFAALWRHSFPYKFWEIVSGETAPVGDMKKKDSPRRVWAEQKEHQFFAPLQNLDEHPYFSNGVHWIYTSIGKLRELFVKERAEAKRAGLHFGICSMGTGIHNVDLNDAPCGCLTPGWRYDAGSLGAAWHENQWADYIVPKLWEYGADVALMRFEIANSEWYRPYVLRTGDELTGAAILDADVEMTGDDRG